ncbi:MAG: NAD(P)/FAD-dependent oxidoreductase [Pseudomonadales bacterium]|nr:NAD(P)/FAD-dependent oxidoreductase [Halioglobus sp.]MCP5130495.1 NAD(P)/FAD-dependent oxidoreductase [Pseudomonadales bacterium]
MKRIVVVGGGAGGLELVSRLGRKYRRREDVEITLVDAAERHLWKPLLHEVATGFMDIGADALEYRAHALKNGYRYCFGEMQGVDRDRREIELAPLFGSKGQALLPVRHIPYDYLVLAVGSVSNDFGTPGVAQNCITLDSSSQAVKLHEQLTEELLRFSGTHSAEPVTVAIVGGGATGVELAAVQHHVIEVLKKYAPSGVEGLASAPVQRFLKITLVEAGPRLLPPLPESISAKALQTLQELGVDVRVSTQITEATSEGLITRDGELIPACIMVWAAGVKGANFLRDLAGLETGRNNQLVVTETLQTTRDPAVFAIGDCASRAMGDGRFVPPRAQSAHQMADNCYRNLVALERDGAAKLQPYHYKDMGSLVNLARYKTLGAMMGPFATREIFVEGLLARLAYLSLYRMHQIALHGYLRTVYFMWAGRIHRTVRRMIKLH